MKNEDPRHQFGRAAENLASEWLRSRFDLRLLARNFRCRVGEVDLIFEESRPRKSGGAPTIELVFVEVRARRVGALQSGLESVGWAKRARLRRAIAFYLQRYRGPAQSARVDIVEWDGQVFRHVPDVWLESSGEGRTPLDRTRAP